MEKESATLQTRERRVATHSHIKGLGLGKDGKCSPDNKCGFVGQNSAREGAGVLVDMVKSKRMAGFALLITGPSGSGKTALALAMSQELGEMVPFCPMVGSEVYSAEVRKTEVLQEMMRRSISLKVREVKEVWEGEVVEMMPHETASSTKSSSHISHVDLVLRAQKGTKTLKMDPQIWESLMRQKVKVGDIILIESGNGALKRLGRSDSLRPEADLEADTYLPLPRGEVYKTREVVQEVTLHDLDVANSRPTPRGSSCGPTDFMNQLMSQMMQGGGSSSAAASKSISSKLRGEVDRLVNKYLESGTAELSPGVLFIDEAHMLDADCFTFLNRALESPISPIIVFATNRCGVEVVRGSNGCGEKSPHGIPHELLDRLLIIRTESLAVEEMPKVIDYRLKMENGPLPFGEAALNHLALLALNCSLRYSLQLLTPSSLLASQNGKFEVEKEDVEEASLLFLDTKRSTNILEERMIE